MKKHLSVLLVLAMLVSSAVLTACGDNDAATTTSGRTSGKSTTPVKTDASSQKTQDTLPAAKATTAGAGTSGGSVLDDPYYDALMALYRPYNDAVVANPEAFLQDAANKCLMNGTSRSGSEGLGLFGAISDDLSVYTNYENQGPANMFDADTFSAEADSPSTKWCGESTENEYSSAIVWSMSKPVNVTGYSFTTGEDNATYTSRGPITWRLYGCNGEIPSAKLDSASAADPEMSYFDTYTVPQGWVLLDGVDAMKDGNPLESVFPDENFAEVLFQLKEAGTYQHFMLLIDTNESNCIQISDFNLYGTPAEG